MNETPLADLHLTVSGKAPSDWNELMEADRDSDFFHSLTWAKSVCRHYPGMKSVYLILRSGEDLVGGLVAFQRRSGSAGGLATRLDSGFDGASGGPIPHAGLSTDRQEEIFQILLQRFLSLRSRLFGVCTISLNAGHEQRFGHLVQKQQCFNRSDITGAAVDLTGGSEDVSARLMTMNKRNERNKGLRRGAEIIVSDDINLVAEYYAIYQSASLHWGIDPVPLAFLQDLLVEGGGQVFFVAIVVDGKVVGGHLNLHQGERVIAWNGVTNPEYSRTHYPATLCMWGDIVEACQRGATWLDMGASGGVASLVGFKKYFGAVLEERSLYVNESPLFSLMLKVRDLFQSGSQTAKESPEKKGSLNRWHDKLKPKSDNSSNEDT